MSSALIAAPLLFFPARFLRTLVLMLSCTLLLNGVCYAAPPLDSATARQKVTARGVGKGVKLVRKDGSEIKGRIVSLSADSVDVRPKGSTTAVTVAFQDVAAVKGQGLSTDAKIGIGVGIGVAVSAGILAIIIKYLLDNRFYL